MACHQGHHLECAGQQGSAGDTALAQVVVDRRVRGHNARQAQFLCQFDDGDDVLVGQIGCDLDEEGHDAVRCAGLAAASCGLENRAQVVDRLQVTQAGSVR